MEESIIKPNILIVDDISTNLVIISEMIKELGYIPRPVISVEQAQKAIQKKMPNLILLDVSMPDITGFEYCAMLKSDVSTRDIPIIFISALDSMEDKVKGFQLGAVDYIAKPFKKEEVSIRLETHLKIYRMQLELESYNRRLHKMVNDQMRLVQEEQRNLLHALASLIETKDIGASGHLDMLGHNCRLMALSLQLSPQYDTEISESFVDQIEVASQLHDIGFIAINDIIKYKEEELTEDEWKELQRHPQIGAKHLEEIYRNNEQNEFIKMAVDIAHYHHENWDGSGYPEGLKGTQIPLAARIVKILDCFDVLNRRRCYRPAYTLQECLEIMQKENGHMFDPGLMEVFFKILNQLQHEEGQQRK